MGGAAFTPLTRNWKWFQNDGAEPSTQYANENTEYSGSGPNTTIFRLRWNWAETGGKASNNSALAFEYSTNQTNWSTPGSSAAWDYGSGQGTHGNTVTSYKLTDTSTYGEYIETTGGAFSFTASSNNEFDIAITPGSGISSGTRYYFRAVIAGTGRAYATGESYPSIVFTITVPSPSVTPSVSPSVTPSVSPSVTPSVSPSVTPSVSPSVTPSVSRTSTPSITPSITTSPSITPSLSVTPSVTPSEGYTPSFPSTCLLSYYSFEEASGIIYDSYGSVNFTTYNSPEYQRSGKIGYGIGFSGATNPGANCGASRAGLDPNGDEYTISCWVFLNSLPTTEGHDFYIFYGSLSASPYYNVSLSVNSGTNKVSFSIQGASDSYRSVLSSDVLSTNTWYHLVGVANGIGNRPVIYVNNTPTSGTTNQAGDIYNSSGTYSIGSPYDGSVESFHGVIDELAIFNCALSSSDISVLYNDGNGLQYAPPPPSSTPSVSSSVSPSVTPSISTSPSLTPSVTPSISSSVTPSISVSRTTTPSVTPSVSPSPISCGTGIFPSEDLQAYWKLDESSGNVIDQVSSYSLAPANSPTYGSEGKINTAVSFLRASNQRFQSYSSGFPILDSIGYSGLTMALWVNPTEAGQGTTRGLAALRGNIYFYIYITSTNKIGLMTNINGTGTTMSGDVVVSPSTWYHVAIVLNRDSYFDIYVNGIRQTNRLDVSGSAGTNVVQNVEGFLYVGNYGTSASYAFDGSIDEYGVWNRGLTSDEILTLYNCQSGLTYTPEISPSITPSISPSITPSITPSTSGVFPTTCLLAYYKMEESSGNIYDSYNNIRFVTYGTPDYHQVGKIDYGINFSGSTNPGAYNEDSYESLNPGGDQYTFSSWIFMNSLPSIEGHEFYIMRGTIEASPYSNMKMIVSTDDKLSFVFSGPSDSDVTVTTPSTLSTNIWYHVVGVVAGIGNKSLLYINNVVTSGSTTQSGNIYDSDKRYTIGSPHGGYTQNFHGVIDEMSFFNCALTSSEISALYNNGNGLQYTGPQASPTPSISVTPTITPSISIIPSITPSITPSPSEGAIYSNWVVKFSTISVPNTTKSKNMVFGSHGVQDWGQTSITGFWNGLNAPDSGYTIYYMTEARQEPIIYIAHNDDQCIYFAKQFGGTGINTINDAITYLSQTNPDTNIFDENGLIT